MKKELNEQFIIDLSKKKNEPDWMLEFRLKSYKKFKSIYENYPKSDFGIASAYRAAKIAEKGNPKIAKELYLSYIESSPEGKFSPEAVNSIKELNYSLNPQESEVIAKALLVNQNYLVKR